jgi:hypothetical protein
MELANKSFPENYSRAVLAVLDALSMTHLRKLTIVGSSSIRSQQYSADYDAMEKVSVNSASEVVDNLQTIIKKLRTLPDCFIGDIKCGEVPEWDPFSPNAHVNMDSEKIIAFNIKQSQSKIDSLLSSKVISPEEARGALKLLKKATNPLGFLTARKEIRYHILRWKPHQILEGRQSYRGSTFTLEDAVMSGGLIKIDIVANIDNRFTEFSVIYNIYKGGVLITKKPLNLINSLKEDVAYYGHLSPFKGMKRMFALAKAQKNESAVKNLVPLLNSDLGRLYQIVGDLSVLHELLERPTSEKPINEIRYQLDEMKARIGNLYQLRDFLKAEHDIIGQIESALKKQNPKADIYKLMVLLQHILNEETLKHLGIQGGGVIYSILNKLVKKLPRRLHPPARILPEEQPQQQPQEQPQEQPQQQEPPPPPPLDVTTLSNADLKKLYIETRDNLVRTIYGPRRRAEYVLDPEYIELGRISRAVRAEIKRRRIAMRGVQQ